MITTTRRRVGFDVALAVLLFGATVAYLAALPRNPAASDEAIHLLEARRILDGQVVYRDFFDLVTPGWLYLMAGLFHLFGATLTTARIAAAVIHGLTAAALFLICRRVGVRRELALGAAVVHVVVAQAVFPIASYHWLATLLAVILLLFLTVHTDRRPIGCFVLGLVVALMIAVHQQRGASTAVGVVAFLIADAWLGRKDRSHGRAGFLPRLVAFGLGVIALTAPLIAFLVVQAGATPVWEALVLQPVINYRHAISCSWGHVRGDGYTIPNLLRYLPLALLFSAPRTLAPSGWARGDDRTRIALLLTVSALSSILSIWYYPDYIHLALIAPTFFVLIAEGLQRILSALPRPLQPHVGRMVALCVLVPSLWWLQGTAADLHARFFIRYESAFGAVDVRNRVYVSLLETLDRLLGPAPSRVLYCHPRSLDICLLLGTRNPTRFELLANGYNSPGQYQEVIDTLRASAVPYIVVAPALLRDLDPLEVFIRAHYAPLSDAKSVDRYIWHRTGVAPPSNGA